MTKYFKYILLIFTIAFSFYYTDKVFKFSLYNNIILSSIDEYASKNDIDCIEGTINEEGLILGFNGIIVDKNKSYSNMKGNSFDKELLEFKHDECILTKENNYDKYIISGNNYEKNISLVIDVESKKYYENMIEIFEQYNIPYNLLINNNFNDIKTNNILFKGEMIKEFKKRYDNFYCVKTNNYEIINDCEKYEINSIKMINYFDKDLYTNTKKILNKGIIIFIKETNINLIELPITIKYIQSRGYNIVSIDDLLS